ncbi:glycosyltransferase family 2 protein [Pontibacter diazotrophicus]|uniref:Glycosyltransferase family 2 protein n=1 Tax=Pontibacter diazotrophicus TaxID=1400979 RepID=A0A3D8KZZ5_9BACT|nr:glycosyltransferase family A protein [Pontibacter diazotrophicus]RDV10665.1 glycosyltransferase family 2 protein [Pontibacter diazotrophicus]
MTAPLLSVVMLVFNGEKYLNEAIESVLTQTFKDFELIIINDGSTDKSIDIISSYSDKRIRLLDNKNNSGIPYCRNIGLNLAKGEFLTWSDCDDINLPDRFEKQIDFLRSNPSIGGCGTWLLRFKGSKSHYVQKADKDPEFIKACLIFKPAIPNATVMLRLSEIRKFKLYYNTNLPIAEDYDFILRCSKYLKFSNIQEVLYKYRDSETSIMEQYKLKEEKSYQIHKIVYAEALEILGITPSESDLVVHRSIGSQSLFESLLEFISCYNWLLNIQFANNRERVFDQKILNKVLAAQFYFISKKASKFGLATLKYYLSKSLLNKWNIKPYEAFKLFIRCSIRYNKF